MRRGTEATVPMVPGFVSVMVAPAKSSGRSLLPRAFSTSDSYVAWKVAKSMRSACLMTGTTRARLPSFFSTSTARPRFTPCGSRRCGFPSTSWNACVMTGSCFAAWTIAKPIRCVNETFFPRAASWAFSSLRRASSVSTTMSRNDVAVGTDSESVMFWTRRAAGPTIGVRPGLGVRGSGLGARASGVGAPGGIPRPEPRGPSPSTSSRLVGITGSSASLPLSKRLRHSSPTEAGSRKYCSYITCTNAALWVPKTNSLTSSNLISCQLSAISCQYIRWAMSRCYFLLLGLLPCGSGAAQTLPSVRERVAARVAQAPATGLGLYYRSLTRPDSLLLGANLRFHAASTMKLPVMIQIFRDADAGLLRLDDSLTVRATFPSLLDGSPFDVDRADDSDSTLYLRLGGKASVRELLELMITRSSNLATNLLIERVRAPRAQASARALGAWSIQVLRGVEDGKAYRAGLNNTTTARDLGALLAAIAQQRAATSAACDAMLAILERQEFNEGIPVGLPPGTRVAHKTGWIGEVVYHDAAVVYRSSGGSYVLVVLTGGIKQDSVAHNLVADLSRLVYGADSP